MINLVFFEDVFGWGGIETFIVNACTRLDPAEYNISIVAINKITDRFDQDLEKSGIKFVELVHDRYDNPIKRFKKGLSAFDKYLRDNHPEIMHFNLSDSIDLLYVNIAKKHGVGIRILHSHNSFANAKWKIAVHYIGKVFFSNGATDYIACSRKAAKWLFPLKIYDNNDYILMHNAIPSELYVYDGEVRKKIRAEYNLSDKFVVGHVGRFNQQKNHIYLLNVFKEIKKIKNNAVLMLFGEGELIEEVQKYAHENSIDDVIFAGMSDQIPSLLQAFDVFILPSFYEGLPFVLVESQAASLPSVASDTITKEVKITPYLQYMSLNKSPKKWAEVAINNAKMKRKSTQELIIQSGFDVDETIKQLDKLYKTLMSRKQDE